MEQIGHVEDRLTVGRLLAGLDGRTRRCLVLLYGLDGAGERTHRGVGRMLGISRGRVWQLEVRALEDMRALIERTA